MTPYDAGYAAYSSRKRPVFRNMHYYKEWQRGWNAAEFDAGESWWNSLPESARVYWLKKVNPRGDASVEEAWRCYRESKTCVPTEHDDEFRATRDL